MKFSCQKCFAECNQIFRLKYQLKKNNILKKILLFQKVGRLTKAVDIFQFFKNSGTTEPDWEGQDSWWCLELLYLEHKTPS